MLIDDAFVYNDAHQIQVMSEAALALDTHCLVNQTYLFSLSFDGCSVGLVHPYVVKSPLILFSKQYYLTVDLWPSLRGLTVQCAAVHNQ